MNYVPIIFFIMIFILAICFRSILLQKGRLWAGITFLVIAVIVVILMANFEKVKKIKLDKSSLQVEFYESKVLEVKNDNKSKLAAKYQDYTVAGIIGRHIIIPNVEQPKEFNIDWASAKIIEDTKDKIEILMPNITYKTNKYIDIVAIINKRVGGKYSIFNFDNYVVEVEVLSIEKGLTVIAIGVVKN